MKIVQSDGQLDYVTKCTKCKIKFTFSKKKASLEWGNSVNPDYLTVKCPMCDEVLSVEL